VKWLVTTSWKMVYRKRTVSRMKFVAGTALLWILFYGCLSERTVTDSQRLPNVTDKVLTGEFVGMEVTRQLQP